MRTPAAARPEGFPGQRLVVVPREIVAVAAARPVTRDLCVTHIGSFTATAEHYVIRPRGTPQHILIGCVAGRGRCRVHGCEWPVAAGELVFLPPRRAHAYQADAKTPWTIFWIHFRGSRARDHLENLGVSPARPLLQVAEMDPLVGAFEDTFRHVTHGFGAAAMTGLTTGLGRLLGLAKVHSRRAGIRAARGDERLLKVLAALRADPAAGWTLATMAREAGLSAAHLSELCRRQTGLSPLAWLIRLRLQRAMNLLVQGGRNVAEVAREVGYDDPFYFSRVFRKHIGVPPSQIRGGP